MTVALGSSDLAVAPLALGGNVFGWTADEQASFAILDAFVAGGGNLVDTADSYSAFAPGNHGGESETVIGRWIDRRGRHDDVVIATKVSRHPDFRGLAPDTVVKAADASLARLGVEALDLYFAHYDDEGVPLADTLGAFDALVEAGKIRYYALSNYAPERIEEALATARREGLRAPVALQPQYSLVEREPYESGYAPVAARENLGVMPYFALAAGFLTGKYRRGEAGGARGKMVSRYLDDGGFAVLDVLREVAADAGASPTATALAWLRAQPTVTAPIASASKVEQVPDLLAGMTLDLTAAQVERLAATGASGR